MEQIILRFQTTNQKSSFWWISPPFSLLIPSLSCVHGNLRPMRGHTHVDAIFRCPQGLLPQRRAELGSETIQNGAMMGYDGILIAP
jgi:hypothetical protein